MKARLVDVDGKDTIIEPKNGTDFSLSELYKLIECELVEVVTLQSGKYMIMDEEGKLKGKAINKLASSMYKPYEDIVGKVVICERSMFK
jgi:hypothetical protein